MTLLNVFNTPFWLFCSTLLPKLLPSFLSMNSKIPIGYTCRVGRDHQKMWWNGHRNHKRFPSIVHGLTQQEQGKSKQGIYIVRRTCKRAHLSRNGIALRQETLLREWGPQANQGRLWVENDCQPQSYLKRKGRARRFL